MLNIIKFAIIIYIWLYLSIFFHEMGHFICAKIVKLKPYSLEVGSGYKLLIYKLFNTRFEFRIFPSQGITSVFLTNLYSIKSRLLLYSAGGIIVNSLFFILFFKLFLIFDKFIFFVLAAIEFWQVITSALPDNVIINDRIMSNDGKQIITYLFSKNKKIFDGLFNAYQTDLMRYENYNQQSNKKFLNNDLQAIQNLMNSEYESSKENFETAIALLLEILKLPNLSRACHQLELKTR